MVAAFKVVDARFLQIFLTIDGALWKNQQIKYLQTSQYKITEMLQGFGCARCSREQMDAEVPTSAAIRKSLNSFHVSIFGSN